jgi:hypothetical protein
MKHIYFFITLLILLTIDVTAQVTLVAPTKMVRSGDSVVVELRAKSQASLSTLQFTLSWNATLLSFGRVDTLGGLPPSAITDEFGMSNTASGKLTFVWISTSNAGFRVVDSIEIFKIVFKATGANGTSCPIQFVASPTPIKASNADLVSIAVTSQEGSVKIGTTAIKEQTFNNLPKSGLRLEQNKPNPFQNQTVIPFYLSESDNVVLAVFDLNGQKLLEKKAFFNAGSHEWLLNTEGVLQSGSYIYSVKTQRGIESKVFIVDRL